MNARTPPSVALRVVITGRVQGVGFRESLRSVARRVGVSGWVRNVRDGSVEAWLEGDRTAVESVAAWCQTGPRHGAVTGVEVSDQTPSGEQGFTVTM